MIYFYFLCGQSITFTIRKFWVSFLTLIGVYLIILATTDINTYYYGFTLFAGWISVVGINEFILKLPPLTDRLKTFFDHDLSLLIIGAEFVVYILISAFIIDNELFSSRWGILLSIHAIYNAMLLWHASNLPQFEYHEHRIKYYAWWFHTILTTDIVFLLISLFELASIKWHVGIIFGVSSLSFLITLFYSLMKNAIK